MANRSMGIPDDVLEYLLGVGVRESELLARLRAETAEMPGSSMQIAPEQGSFMALIAELMQARSYLEVGTFTGYSSTAVGMAMPSDARIVCCDTSEEWTNIAIDYWAEAGLTDLVELRLGPAILTLDSLLTEGAEESFDLAFIDADKSRLGAYYDRVLRLVRVGGLIMIDNVLWGGRVADPTESDSDTTAIRELNESLVHDDRISISMVPIGDGLTLARKR